MSQVEILHGSKVVSRSRNLRGILTYARIHNAHLAQQGLILHVTFGNGAFCSTTFASETVLRQWIANRITYGRGKFSRDSQ